MGTRKKYEDVFPTAHNLEVPVVVRSEYILSLINERTGSVSVITETCTLKNDLNLPTVVALGEPTAEDVQLAATIVEAYNNGKMVSLVVISALGIEKVVGAKITA